MQSHAVTCSHMQSHAVIDHCVKTDTSFFTHSTTTPIPMSSIRGCDAQVVAMNTYIGLLGELYSEAVQKKNQIYNHYLAAVMWPHLYMWLGPKIWDIKFRSFPPSWQPQVLVSPYPQGSGCSPLAGLLGDPKIFEAPTSPPDLWQLGVCMKSSRSTHESWIFRKSGWRWRDAVWITLGSGRSNGWRTRETLLDVTELETPAQLDQLTPRRPAGVWMKSLGFQAFFKDERSPISQTHPPQSPTALSIIPTTFLDLLADGLVQFVGFKVEPIYRQKGPDCCVLSTCQFDFHTLHLMALFLWSPVAIQTSWCPGSMIGGTPSTVCPHKVACRWNICGVLTHRGDVDKRSMGNVSWIFLDDPWWLSTSKKFRLHQENTIF